MFMAEVKGRMEELAKLNGLSYPLGEIIEVRVYYPKEIYHIKARKHGQPHGKIDKFTS